MKVLVVGGGAREHALVWKLAQSPEVTELYAAPGNPGIAALARCVPIRPDAIVELADFAAAAGVELTVVGPELPLVLGIGNEFARRGLLLFGPTREAAEIEGSKAFTKTFCQRHGIPTARGEVVHSQEGAAEAAARFGFPVVLKADGLAAGKGVLICGNSQELDEALERLFQRREFGQAAERVVVEEFLSGQEVSFMVITDGSTVFPLPVARDYKRLLDGDRGPNTGGMGAVSPAPVEKETAAAILKQIIFPTLAGMAREGRPFCGALYAGLMLTPEGPKLLEFNCRLGDPEAQVLLPRLDLDLASLLLAAARRQLTGWSLPVKREAAACVVLAAAGYPGQVKTGDVIEGIELAAAVPEALIFHAGTALEDGKLVTAGGRVLSVVGRGPTVAEAVASAYAAAERVHFEGRHMRRDIGARLS